MAGTVNGILAGYDGSPGSEQALEWAVWEARARKVVLTVCHAWAAGRGTADGDAAAELTWHYSERVLSGGVVHAQAVIGTGEVRPLLATGPAAKVLADLSSSADMVVVGSRGRGGLAGLLLGSVSSQVAAHARGPVVVVRGDWQPVPGRPPRPIAVGAGGSPNVQPAVTFAFAEAALRDAPLLAVCALAGTAAIVGGGARWRPVSSRHWPQLRPRTPRWWYAARWCMARRAARCWPLHPGPSCWW